MVMAKSSLMGLFSSTNNPVPSSNVYPSDAGNPLAIAATAGSTATISGGVGPGAAAGAATTPQGGGVKGWIVLVVLYLVLSFVAKKAGQAEEFKNIRLSAYNVLTITLAAILGITLLKVAVTKVPIPGVTPLILAA